MNQNNSKLSKIILCILLGFILMSGCTSNEQAKDPVEVEPSEPVEEKTELELLAEEYEFLQWHLDDSTTKTVDGVTYDLAALKDEYGDLYRFVEPLSKEEVEYRFQYLAEYFADQAEKGIYEKAAGGLITNNNGVNLIVYPKFTELYGEIYKQEYEKLTKYSKYYKYLSKTEDYITAIPNSLKFENEFYNYNLIRVIDDVEFEEKDWFIRDYLFQIDVVLNAYKLKQVNPDFQITISK